MNGITITITNKIRAGSANGTNLFYNICPLRLSLSFLFPCRFPALPEEEAAAAHVACLRQPEILFTKFCFVLSLFIWLGRDYSRPAISAQLLMA